jgi:hypothetical protein
MLAVQNCEREDKDKNVTKSARFVVLDITISFRNIERTTYRC